MCVCACLCVYVVTTRLPEFVRAGWTVFTKFFTFLSLLFFTTAPKFPARLSSNYFLLQRIILSHPDYRDLAQLSCIPNSSVSSFYLLYTKSFLLKEYKLIRVKV